MNLSKHIRVLVFLFTIGGLLGPAALQASPWDGHPRDPQDTDWVWIEWMGWLKDADYPHVYQPKHGWLYQVSSSEGNVWFYDWYLQKWSWTSQDYYSRKADGGRWFYFPENDLWLHYAAGKKPNRWWQTADGSYLSDAEVQAL